MTAAPAAGSAATLTLREIASEEKYHSKLSKMKIITNDTSEYKFFALVDDTSYIMWACASSADCRCMVATDFDGVLVNTINCHAAFCPASVTQRKKRKEEPAATIKEFNGVKLREVLVPFKSLDREEIATGVLKPTSKYRLMLPINNKLTLPDSIPKAYSKKSIQKATSKKSSNPTLSQHCRMCGEVSEKMTLILGFDGTHRDLKFKLEWLLSKNIADDDKLPMKLCASCIVNLNLAYDTFIMAMRTQERLREMADKQGIKFQVKKEDPHKKIFNMLYKEEREKVPLGSTCWLCKEDNIVDLRKHNVVFHSEFLCRICNDAFANKDDLAEHMEARHLRSCEYCSCSFETQKGYELHLRSHEICKTPGMKFVPCQFCKETFHNKKELQEHLCTVHLQEIVEKQGPKYMSISKLTTVKEKEELEKECEQAGLKIRQTNNYDLVCRICEEKSQSLLHLVKHHREKHNKYFCDKCKESFDERSALEEHIPMLHDQYAVACNECDEVFRSVITLENHTKAFHLNQSTFTCPVCNRLFFSTSKLKAHMHLHLASNDHQCASCGKLFSNKASYLNHLRLHDESRELLHCAHCTKTFQSKKYLIVHIKSHHLSTWYYKCLECGKEHSTLDDITVHCNESHPNAEIKVQRLSHAVCNFCNREFGSEVVRDRHVYNNHRVNKGKTKKLKSEDGVPKIKKTRAKRRHICRECDMVFPTNADLALHKESVHNLQKFSCDICPNRHYTYEGLLRQHEVKVHHIIREFQCPSCDAMFNTSRKLAQHKAVVHTKLTASDLVCHYCDKQFTTKLTLQKHMGTHTEDVDPSIQYVTVSHQEGGSETTIRIALEGLDAL
ncbi:zinc finger protein 888-like isoform X1 [Neocloeon triangulifer]|uniref:zinc finger protein 888-like isoform X1 n=1 Tax=Neocloeon triangulifer TaxID=2078957 RepID=UPI00286F1706|nr:zinc finger protein 888-like isoform X1 [Neocloeon triangulifer]